MKIAHKEWVKKNINDVNKSFGIDLTLETKEEYHYFDKCIDVYDSEEDFNSDFESEYNFKVQFEDGGAKEIDGKYVYLNEINYEDVINERRIKNEK